MRTSFLALAALLWCFSAQAQDQLIKLPKAADLEAVIKVAPAEDAPAEPGKAAAPVKEVQVKDAGGLKEKIAASDEAAAKAPPASAAQAKPPTGASDDEEEDIQRLAERISSRLAALRQAREARPKPAPVARKKVVAKESAHDGHGHLPAHWSYEGAGGPANWGKLNPAWAKCENGTRQSPIDIRDGIKVDLEQVVFDYKPARFNVVDNGHTIQVNVGIGNTITLTGRTYELVQFHFHHPAEERVDGRGFPMVMHLVHKDSVGRLAVIAVLIQEGVANPAVQTVWNNLPLDRNDPVYATGLIELPFLLPASRDYYTYMGSLTTPPCSEGVLWIVFKQPIQMSDAQIAIFSRLYPMNARPVQSLAGRVIKESN